MTRLLALLALTSVCAVAQPAQGWLPELDRAGVTDERIRAAMQKVRRADFLPDEQKKHELVDLPLPIGHGQTTSQPTLIAQMIQALKLEPGCRVLEVGTGSGYQTALLAELCEEVVSIEIIEPIAAAAKRRLTDLGYQNVRVKAGDGYLGWPEHAPFEGITVGAGATRIPQPLIDQLAPGGRLVIPVGEGWQMQLNVVTKGADGKTVTQRTLEVGFVPLTGPNADRDRRRGKRAPLAPQR